MKRRFRRRGPARRDSSRDGATRRSRRENQVCLGTERETARCVIQTDSLSDALYGEEETKRRIRTWAEK